MADEGKTKSLSLKQAQRCEQAIGDVCHCRCKGTHHGKKRNGSSMPGLDFFNELPKDDPHYLPTEQEKREARNAAKREETRIKNERIAAAWEKLSSRPVGYGDW